MIHRRGFFRGLVALGLLPAGELFAEGDGVAWPMEDDPHYWQWIRRQFPFPADESYFNTGTLGACPRQVLDAVIESMRRVEATEITHYAYSPQENEYIAGYRPQIELRAKAGRLIHAGEREMALLQNATTAVNFVANGLDLQPGDEVLLTDQEHHGVEGPWNLRAKRHGIVVRKVPVPVPTPDPGTVVKIFADAIGPRTRVIAVPHITSRYGIVLPVQQICQLGRQRGLFTCIDGAQALGQLRVNVKEIGCDAYAASPHKWLLAPPGNGLLYVREERLAQLWATLASEQWDQYGDGAFRLMQFGTANRSLLDGLNAALDFHLRIGPERVEQRIFALASRLRDGLRRVKGVEIYSPTHPALAGAMVTYGVSGVSGNHLQDELWNRKKIRVRAQNEFCIRQSVHIYNSPEEIDATLEVVKSLATA